MTADTPADPPGPRRITRPLLATLRALHDAADAELHVAEIAAASGVSANTTLVLMRRMEHWGSVTARWSQPPAGRPVRLFRLTAAGVRLAEHLTDDQDAPTPQATAC